MIQPTRAASQRRYLRPAYGAVGVFLLVLLTAACLSGAPRLSPENTRDFAAEAERLVEILALKPGGHVADVGAGQGEWTVPLAEAVLPGGRAWATEVKESKLEDIEDSLDRAGLSVADGVRVVLGNNTSSGLPDGCCDAILLRRVYHHFIDPAAMGQDLYRALKPGGLLVVVDYSSYLSSPVEGVPENRTSHGLAPEIVVEETSEIGFQQIRLIEPWMGLDNMYCLVLRRPSAPPES